MVRRQARVAGDSRWQARPVQGETSPPGDRHVTDDSPRQADPDQGETSPPGDRRTLLQRPLLWFSGVVVAAVTGLLVTTFTDIGSQLLDQPHLNDQIRPWADMRITSDVVQLDDEGSSMATRDDRQLGAALLTSMQQSGAAASRDVVKAIHAAGGVNVETLSIRLVLEGRRNEEIRILNISPVVVEQTAPLSGTLFYAPPQAGGADLMMLLDFDRHRPVVSSIIRSPEGGPALTPGQPYFDTNTISLKDNEQQVVMLRAQVKKYYVAFKLRVEYLIGGEKRSIDIDNNGSPFAVTGMHVNPTDNAWSYQRGFGIDGSFRYCRVQNPQDFTGASKLNC